jgi:hypothetical protein
MDSRFVVSGEKVQRIPTVTTALWGCLIARNAYAYS